MSPTSKRRRSSLLVAALAAVAGVLTITACSSEPNAPSDTVSVAVAPTSINVAAGGSGSATATITRGGSFSGAVTLSATGAPTGVGVTFTPAIIPAGSTTATVDVTVAAAVAVGSKTITINAAGNGVTTATTTLIVVVVGEGAGSIALAASPATLTATVGGAVVTSTVTITRNAPFAGPVALTITGAPAGLTATLNPTSVTGTTSTLSVQAMAGAASGAYPLVIHGTGTGVADATTTVTVTVSGGSGGGGNFTVAFCTADAPLWVAQQDGSGAWTRVTPSAGSTYQFAFPSGKGGVAFVDTVGTGTDLTVVYGTVAEFTGLGGSANFNGCGAKIVNGTVANVGAAELASVSLGFSSATTFQGKPGLPAFPAFVLNNVAEGSLDLIATRTDAATFAANKVILRRGLNVNGGGSLAQLDFNAAEAFVPGTANVTVTGLGTDEASIISSYTGVYGSRTAGSLSLTTGYTTGAVPYTAIPVAQLSNALELSQLSAFADDAANSDFQRLAGVYFRTPANKTIAVGPIISTPTVTKVVTAPNARPRVQLTGQAQYNRLFSANYDQSSLQRSANVFATAGYFGSLPVTWDITLPDLSGAAGWTTAWGLADGTAIEWGVTVQGGAIQFLDANSIVDGSTFQSASVFSSTPLALRAARSGADAFALQRRLLDILQEQNRNPLH